jgi:tRNA(fMet)-specific endonuclease VapC
MNQTGSVLLDTTIVVDHLRGKAPSVIEQFRQTTTLYLPVTALGELLFGAYKSAFKVKSLEQIKSFIQLCAILGVDERTADYYGRIGAELGRLGKLIPQNDIWIAAIALGHDLPLATRDRHFSFVPGLTQMNWWLQSDKQMRAGVVN